MQVAGRCDEIRPLRIAESRVITAVVGYGGNICVAIIPSRLNTIASYKYEPSQIQMYTSCSPFHQRGTDFLNMKALAILLALCMLAALTQAGPRCPPYDGATPTFYTDHNDPHGFWECSNGIPYHKYCPSGLVWNPHIDTCDWPY